jgi:hypothetical protein
MGGEADMSEESMSEEQAPSKRKSKADRLTYDVPEAGRMAGLGRNASYEAARRGDIPTITFGKLKKVPKAIWDRKLGIVE